ncbi:hypothetical protein [Metabacillus niabensis]|uniref:Flagellar hook-length control protein-like C-terminal domain-containing protein n=1 Tax=Metabacillus niabensis TaxID=324854 RepID=A0ABT9Z5W0_9BACI|nr:hypothetical protein [Metabacillus niabensis]MDQ0227624.1 hypothetical protein [Metabacillus niabensis]
MEQTTGLSNLIRQTFSNLKNSQPQLTLKENQVVLGQVQKLFPEQKALIQIGQATLVAQLETAIKGNESYWFTVKGTEHTGLKLKVMKQVEGLLTNKIDTAKDLLEVFQLKNTKQNLALTREILKENIPITKEQLVAATDVLKNTPNTMSSQAIHAIVFALKQNYPISNEIIKSLMSIQTSTPLVQQIDKVLQLIQAENNQSGAIKQLYNVLSNLTENQTDHFDKKLLDLMKNPEQLNGHTLSSKEVLNLKELHVKLTMNNDEQIKSMLKQALQQNEYGIEKPQIEQASSLPIKENQKLTMSNLEQLKTLLNQLVQQNEQPLNKTGLTQPSSATIQFKENQLLLSQDEIMLIRKLAANVPLLSAKENVLDLFKTLDNKIGLQDEVKLWDQLMKGKELEGLLSLKNSLIAARNEIVSTLAREEVDQLIHRFNGQTLIQQDNGPTQQFISQYPLFLPHHQTDLTIQWDGKKREDGSIDPAFCRIIFFLSLPRLKDVMIDVQIQNRVMNISILNNNSVLAALVASKSEVLKQTLETMNYRISSIAVKPFEKENKVNIANQVQTIKSSPFYQGVDLKI